jgi:hypothetical protein
VPRHLKSPGVKYSLGWIREIYCRLVNSDLFGVAVTTRDNKASPAFVNTTAPSHVLPRCRVQNVNPKSSPQSPLNPNQAPPIPSPMMPLPSPMVPVRTPWLTPMSLHPRPTRNPCPPSSFPSMTLASAKSGESNALSYPSPLTLTSNNSTTPKWTLMRTRR